MRHNLKFQSILPLPIKQYDFTWDDESGSLTGEGSGDVKDWSIIVLNNGYIDCPEINGRIKAINPLKNINEFSAMIGFDNLPESLKPFFPDINYKNYVPYLSNDINLQVVY